MTNARVNLWLTDDRTRARRPAPVRLDDLIETITKVHSDPLDQLTDAVLAADHLGDVADHLIGHFVDQARRSGASWTEIGRSMGVTKQAAQKRFVTKPATRRTSTPARASAASPRGPATSWWARRTRPAPPATPDSPAHLVLGLLAEPAARPPRPSSAAGLSLDVVRAAALADPAAGRAGPVLLRPGASKRDEVGRVRHARRQGGQRGGPHRRRTPAPAARIACAASPSGSPSSPSTR